LCHAAYWFIVEIVYMPILLWHLVEEPVSSSESELDIQSGMEFTDEGSAASDNDDLSDGYISNSGSDASLDTSKHDAVIEETSDDYTKTYQPPQLQPQVNKLKLRKSINGLINRYSEFSKTDCGFIFSQLD